MEFNQFIVKIKTAIQQYVGEEAVVSLNHVTKNNGVILEGISITRKDNNISPTIYLNHFYETYENGTSFGKTVQDIITVYKKNEISENVNMDFFTDYSKARKKIAYKLINYDKNRDLLQFIPHVKYLDLAIVFYCIVINERIGNASILIHNRHCKMWDITWEELFAIAKENTPRLLPDEIRNMKDIIQQIISEDDESAEPSAFVTDYESSYSEGKMAPMYVLSNHTKVNGAACILYPNVISNFAENLQKDIYILPSSIHEVILIPVDDSDHSLELNNMVQEVNMTQVDDEEVLADHAYYYTRVSRQIIQI